MSSIEVILIKVEFGRKLTLNYLLSIASSYSRSFAHITVLMFTYITFPTETRNNRYSGLNNFEEIRFIVVFLLKRNTSEKRVSEVSLKILK